MWDFLHSGTVTIITMQLFVGSVDFEVRLFIVVETPNFPAIRVMTELAIHPKLLFMNIFFSVTAITFLIRILI